MTTIQLTEDEIKLSNPGTLETDRTYRIKGQTGQFNRITSITIDHIKVGDIVSDSGLLTLITEPFTVTYRHSSAATHVFHSVGTIINPDEVIKVIPKSWFADGWTIQSNVLASYTVYRLVSE